MGITPEDLEHTGALAAAKAQVNIFVLAPVN